MSDVRELRPPVSGPLSGVTRGVSQLVSQTSHTSDERAETTRLSCLESRNALGNVPSLADEGGGLAGVDILASEGWGLAGEELRQRGP